MRWSQRIEFLCSIPAENGTIILKNIIDDVRQKNKRICVVVDDKEGVISICIFYCCVSKQIKIGRNRVVPIPSGAQKLCITITQKAGKNPNPRNKIKKGNIQVTFIKEARKRKGK